MAEFNWTYDSDIGIYKNHYISNKLLEVAAGRLKFLPFTTPVQEFGKGMGETVHLMHVKRMYDEGSPVNAQLAEDTRIPIDKIQMGERTITLAEYGRGCEYTNLAQQLGKFDLKSIIQKKLVDQMERVLDTAGAAAFKTTDVKICAIPTSLTGITWDTDGTPTTSATHNLTFDHMGVIADYLAGDIHCPPYQGEEYIMIAARKALRGLKQDTLWQDVHKYLRMGELFFRGEVGKAENIRCIECNRESCLSNSIGTSNVLGEAVIFGDEAVARIEAEAPQLYADPNYQSDFGRTKAVAWRGILAFGSFWNTANDGEAKIIRICSA